MTRPACAPWPWGGTGQRLRQAAGRRKQAAAGKPWARPGAVPGAGAGKLHVGTALRTNASDNMTHQVVGARVRRFDDGLDSRRQEGAKALGWRGAQGGRQSQPSGYTMGRRPRGPGNENQGTGNNPPARPTAACGSEPRPPCCWLGLAPGPCSRYRLLFLSARLAEIRTLCAAYSRLSRSRGLAQRRSWRSNSADTALKHCGCEARSMRNISSHLRVSCPMLYSRRCWRPAATASQQPHAPSPPPGAPCVAVLTTLWSSTAIAASSSIVLALDFLAQRSSRGLGPPHVSERVRSELRRGSALRLRVAAADVRAPRGSAPRPAAHLKSASRGHGVDIAVCTLLLLIPPGQGASCGSAC